MVGSHFHVRVEALVANNGLHFPRRHVQSLHEEAVAFFRTLVYFYLAAAAAAGGIRAVVGAIDVFALHDEVFIVQFQIKAEALAGIFFRNTVRLRRQFGEAIAGAYGNKVYRFEGDAAYHRLVDVVVFFIEAAAIEDTEAVRNGIFGFGTQNAQIAGAAADHHAEVAPGVNEVGYHHRSVDGVKFVAGLR